MDERGVEGPGSGTAEWRVVRVKSGGFRVQGRGGPVWTAEPQGRGWCVAGIDVDSLGRWSLERPGPVGFVLRTPAGQESARTMPLVGADGEGTRYLLLEDARLFRILRRPPRDDGFDLEGWEVPGAYMRAVPEEQGWRLIVEPAGAGLPGVDLLMLLLAAEALDAEQRLRSETG